VFRTDDDDSPMWRWKGNLAKDSEEESGRERERKLELRIKKDVVWRVDEALN
jgi:hypothetical protein